MNYMGKQSPSTDQSRSFSSARTDLVFISLSGRTSLSMSETVANEQHGWDQADTEIQ